jgi:hypothetical protein
MAIEKGMYDLYREDMLKLGLTEEQLPKTPNEIANWHRLYRINGYEVRDTKTCSNVKGKVPRMARRRSRLPSNSGSTSGKAGPADRVSVDRDARRQAIPLQPSRAAAPRRDVQAPAPELGRTSLRTCASSAAKCKKGTHYGRPDLDRAG